MQKGTFAMLLLGGVVAASAFAPMRQAEAFPPPKPPKPHGKHGPDHLKHAYDTLSEVALLMEHGEGKAIDQRRPLFKHAVALYRSAIAAHQDGDDKRAGELGVAANDGGRGLRHLLRATLEPKTDLPAPPDREEKEDAEGKARKDIERAYDRAREASGAGYDDGPGHEFLSASREVYNQARRAFEEGDFSKAGELAKAAEAWTHVGEHLARAEDHELGPEKTRREPPRPEDRERGKRGAELPPALN